MLCIFLWVFWPFISMTFYLHFDDGKSRETKKIHVLAGNFSPASAMWLHFRHQPRSSYEKFTSLAPSSFSRIESTLKSNLRFIKTIFLKAFRVRFQIIGFDRHVAAAVEEFYQRDSRPLDGINETVSRIGFVCLAWSSPWNNIYVLINETGDL